MLHSYTHCFVTHKNNNNEYAWSVIATCSNKNQSKRECDRLITLKKTTQDISATKPQKPKTE